jgi:hypothetical protein
VLTVYRNATFSPVYVLLYGLLFAAVLALFRVSATTALHGRCERLLAEYAPVPDPAAEDISTPLARRRDLAVFLGMGGLLAKIISGWRHHIRSLVHSLIGTVLPK